MRAGMVVVLGAMVLGILSALTLTFPSPLAMTYQGVLTMVTLQVDGARLGVISKCLLRSATSLCREHIHSFRIQQCLPCVVSVQSQHAGLQHPKWPRHRCQLALFCWSLPPLSTCQSRPAGSRPGPER
ncbi:hypothetical protein QBC41DRAFT_315433 [Cercophora samala]|uniref:Uncharacterized protein n=1 Tax=Cercophora samala TaxID=330535 RepID=A0AA39ZI93_9PEZI|nr:hypothetical protein QBC41DRAFT_315433 [Cercophora samala]